MALQVRYFGGLRERLGVESEELRLDDLPENPTVDDAIVALGERHPDLSRYRAHVRVAVNHDFVDDDFQLSAGDELAFIPPVSGGSSTSSDPTGRFRVTEDVIDATAVTEMVRRPDAGAVVSFEGTVRNFTDDHAVDYLEYEAYVDMALKKLVETADEARENWENTEVAIHHRYGRLEIGETAVVIAVSTPHRANGFAATRFIIDRLKEVVPIWKKEVGPEGGEWVGFGP